MIINKAETKLLKYVYKRKTVSYKSLERKFSKYQNLHESIESLVYHHYLIQVGGHQSNLGKPIPITDETLFSMDSLGSSIVESKQWFDTEYVVSHIIVPIVLAVISTLLTLLLTSVLSPSQRTNPEAPSQQELHIQEKTP